MFQEEDIDLAWEVIYNRVYNYGDQFSDGLTEAKYIASDKLFNDCSATRRRSIYRIIHYIQTNDRLLYMNQYLQYGNNAATLLECNYMERFFVHQGYSLLMQKNMAKEILAWITCNSGKRNCLRLLGNASTGKSTLAKCIVQPWMLGYLNTMQSVKNPNFMLASCIGKSMCLAEEPFFTIDVAEEMKKFMAGNVCITDTKHSDAQTLSRMPVLVTTNWAQFGHGLIAERDEAALWSRCITIPITKDFTNGAITEEGVVVRIKLTGKGFYSWLLKHSRRG